MHTGITGTTRTFSGRPYTINGCPEMSITTNTKYKVINGCPEMISTTRTKHKVINGCPEMISTTRTMHNALNGCSLFSLYEKYYG